MDFKDLENIVEICVAIDIAIIGVAYPIIVDKISNIGDKYSSEYLSILFGTEFPQNVIRINKNRKGLPAFQVMLYTTIISFIFLIAPLSPPFGWNNWFINNSAKLFVLILTSILTISFFIWLDKVVLYNGKSTTLLRRIIFRYNNLKEDNEIRSYHLKTINELSLYAIEKQDEHLQKTLLEFYYQIFATIRKNHDKTRPLVYPIDLYFFVNKLVTELSFNQNRKLLAIEHRAVSGNWLLGEDFEDITISNETYRWLWSNLYIICDNTKFIKMYWAEVSQYFDFRLDYIFPDYSFDQNLQEPKILNKEAVDKRDEERFEFLEFHYALGGLLLYRNQYNSIKYIFQYTQSEPPRYPLLPNSMTDIFEWLEWFTNDFSNLKLPINVKYPFPDLDSLTLHKHISYWICSYLVLLFIRQYSLQPYLVTQNFIGQPNIPLKINELNSWFDSVIFFEKCLKDILKNEKLLEDVGLLTLAQSKESDFHDFIDTLKSRIKNKIGDQKFNAPISNDKLELFKASTNQIISNAFIAYKNVIGTTDVKYLNDDLKFIVNGGAMLFSKSAFVEDDIPHLNFDTVIAEQIARNNIKRIIPYSFYVARTKRYLVNKSNLITALEELITNAENTIIVAVNFFDYKTKQLLDGSKFKTLIVWIPSTEYNVENLIYVLNKKYLPAIEHKKLSEEEISKEQLTEINKDYNLYTSVIDINLPENTLFKEKWKSRLEQNNTDPKVEVSVLFPSTIHWKNDREVVQIDITSEFKEQGIRNDISEIEPLQE